MHKRLILLLSLGIMCVSNSAGAQQRELGAHEHGRGTLNIALEGMRLSMELEVPGADVVGFEHAAKTRKDKAAVGTAKKQLSAPLALFKFPASAGCVVKSASVVVEAEAHDHGHAKDVKAHPHVSGDKPGHSQFHAQYEFDCKNPTSVTAIEFDYFRTFPGAEKLDVNLITSKGQSKYEVTRTKPRIDLVGMM